MYRIVVHRRGRPETEIGHGLEEPDVLRLFFILHNAVHVAIDPVPLVCPREGGEPCLIFPEEIRGLRLLSDGRDVTERVLVED